MAGLLAIAAAIVLLEWPGLRVGALIWLVGLGLTALGCWGPPAAGARLGPPVTRAEGWTVGGMVAAGLLSRLWAPESFPNGIHIDEAAMGLVAQEVLQGGGPHPFGFGFIGDPGLFFYAEAGFMGLIGVSVGAVRTMAGLCGALTLPALWLLARPLFGPRVALVAVGLLAFGAAHLHFSRIAVNFAGVPMFGVLGLALAWRGILEGRPAWHLLAGMSVGLAQFVHFGARPWIMALAGTYLVLLAARRRTWRPVFGGGLLAALGLVLVQLPQLAHVRDDPSALWNRLEFRSVFRRWDQATEIHQTTDPLWVMVGQLKVSLLAFVNQTDRSPFYQFAQEPLLFGPVAALFLLGLGLAISRARDPRYATVLLGSSGVLAASALSAGVPQFHRLMPMLPLACLLAAIGAAWLAGWGDRLTRSIPSSKFRVLSQARLRPGTCEWGFRPLSSILLGILVVATAVDGLAAVFMRHPAAQPWQPATAWARWAAAQEPDRVVLLAGAPDVFASDERVRLLARGRDVRDLPNPTVDLPVALAEGRPVAVALSPRLDDWLPLLRNLLPTASVETVGGPREQPLLIQLIAPPESAPPTDAVGLRGELTLDGKAGSTSLTRSDATLAFREASRLSDGEPFRARWTGDLLIETRGEYRLELYTDGAAELLVDGRGVAEGRSVPEPRSLRADVRLEPGPHSLDIRYGYVRGPGILELRWRPPNGERTLIPPAALRPR